MAAQGERELGDIVMGEGLLGPMVQDISEQDIVGEEQFTPPQMDPEPEMGAAAAEAAVYDTSPPLPHQNPSPIPAETAHLSAPNIAQLIAMLAGLNARMEGMESNMNGNAQQMENKMDGMNEKMEANTNGMNEMKEEIKNNTNGMREEMKEMRGEMRQVGRCLQEGKMATPRAGSSELKGSAPAGEDRAIRETCWARRVKVTETVTQGEKLIGVTETCTSETGREVTELTETREVEERLHGVEEKDGVKDAHTHTHTCSEGQWG